MLQTPGKAENESYQIDTSDHPLPDQPCWKTEDLPVKRLNRKCSEPGTPSTAQWNILLNGERWVTVCTLSGETTSPPSPYVSQKCWLPDSLCRKIQNQMTEKEKREGRGGWERREHGCVWWRRDQWKQRGEGSHQCNNLRMFSRTKGHEILYWKHVINP